jgi:methylated-DNA-[protein]-cysteine S-methyltransferase
MNTAANAHQQLLFTRQMADSIELRQHLDTPLGLLQIVACNAGIRQVQFVAQSPAPEQQRVLAKQQAVGTLLNNTTELWSAQSDDDVTAPPRQPLCAEQHLLAAVNQLQQYFAGQRQHFELTLAPTGTAFQYRVWQLLAQIPYGRFCSYGWLAQLLQNPAAVRAVGAANGRNPIAIVLPCHRVVASNGRLTGYAGGLSRKNWLLLHEQHALTESSDTKGLQRQLL